VIITNEQTGTRYQTVTSASGTYVVAGLPLSTYTISGFKPGFQTVTQSGILISAGSNKAVDISLPLGAVTQKVQVTGAAPLLETRSQTVSSTVEMHTLEELPLPLTGWKRDPNQYLTTIPGYQGSAGFSSFINGGVGNTGEITVDGAPVDDQQCVPGWLRQTFSVEAVSEFNYVTDPTADLPNSGTHVLSYTIKSGTNQLHGSVYDYTRNSAMDSRCFFCSAVTADHQSEFGFSVGGPVYVPKVFDGRNKLFFFANIGWSRYHFGAGAPIYTIPTDAFKQGDFSALLGPQMGTDALGRPILQNEIYDPSTTRNVVAGQLDPVTNLVAAANATIRDPFPKNQIPKADWSSVSEVTQSFYPEPNLPGIYNNWMASGGAGRYDEKYWTFKGDWYFGKNHVSGLYYRDYTPFWVPYVLPPEFGPRYAFLDGGHDYRLNWDRTISPNLVSDFVMAYNRFLEDDPAPPQTLVGATTIGLPHPSNTCMPSFSIAGGYMATQYGQGLCEYYQITSGLNATENISLARGKHFLKFGGSIQHFNYDGIFPYDENFFFLPAQTGLPNVSGTGIGYASFLMGNTNSGWEEGTATTFPRASVYGLYVTDEIRVRPNLTVNAGLRWDGQPVPKDNQNLISQFDPHLANPGAGGLPGAMTFFGFGSGRLGVRTNIPNSWFARSFGPRLGLSYKIGKDTVLRASYAMLYAQVGNQDAGYTYEPQVGFIPDFSKASLDGYSPAFNWTDGFPLPPTGLSRSLTPTVANGSETYYLGLNSGLAPRIQQWHFDVQHKIAGDILLQASYLGNNAHGLGSANTENLNQLNYQQYGGLKDLLGQDAYSTQAQAAGIKIPYAGFQGTVAQALLPYPQYLAVMNSASVVGWSTYNAFQFQATKHFSKGLSFLAGYTIAKQIDNAGDQPGVFAATSQDSNNLRAEKGLSDYDIPQQLLFNYTYDLPVGPGKKFASGSNIVEKYVIGGWTLAGMHTYQSGFPLGVGTEETLPTTNTSERANSVPGVSRMTSSGCGNYIPGEAFLNAAAFAPPPAWTFGNTSRLLGNVRNCGTKNESVSLFKNFPLHGESAKLQIGADAFNLFNRHIWASPNTDINSSAFGTITSTSNPRMMTLHARITW
jgi:hypothetical protein